MLRVFLAYLGGLVSALLGAMASTDNPSHRQSESIEIDTATEDPSAAGQITPLLSAPPPAPTQVRFDLAPAYPTDEAERAKQARKAAKERGKDTQPKKRHQVVEQHVDDCGADQSPLLYLDELSETRSDDAALWSEASSDSESDFALLASLSEDAWLYGSTADEARANLRNPCLNQHADVGASLSDVGRRVAGVEFVELFGGAGLTTQLLVRSTEQPRTEL
jgi:hypothetical protein